MGRFSRIAVAVALVVGGALAHAGSPLPAISSKKAHKSLLLDVARAGDRLVAVGERGHIVLSDDAGATWRQAPVPVRSMLTAVYFASPTHGWAVGHDSVVLATTDGGNSWAIQHYQEFDPGALAGGADDAPVDEAFDDAAADAYVDDEAMDETGSGRAVSSRAGVPLLDVWFANPQSGVAVGAYGLVLRTADGGKTWNDISGQVPNRDGWHFNAISGTGESGQVVFIAGEKGTLYRSTDGGASFSAIASPYQGSFFGVTGSASGLAYVYGLQGSMYRTADNGGSWMRIETGVTSGLNDGCQKKDGTLLIAGNAGVVLTGANGSTSFTTVRRPDRQSVLSCADVGSDIVLVGEGGARLASAAAKQ